MSVFRDWLSRGEMPDPVDDAFFTAAAILRPDALPDPGWCVCRECQPDLYLIPPTEET